MMMRTGNDPLMFMAVSDEETRRNFWNHHSLNYLETIIQRAQAEAAPNLSPEATIANAIEGTAEDNEREDIITPSKFDDGISEEIILDESAERSDDHLQLSLKDRLQKNRLQLTAFLI